jgi:hypothetical protein
MDILIVLRHGFRDITPVKSSMPPDPQKAWAGGSSSGRGDSSEV